MKRTHFIIHGKVHGVFYRESTKKQAQKLGIVGWVKNCLDGTVEIVAEGYEEILQEFFVWCKEGPEMADVEQVEEEWSDIEKSSFYSFEITS
jgi:acylphosphatase